MLEVSHIRGLSWLERVHRSAPIKVPETVVRRGRPQTMTNRQSIVLSVTGLTKSYRAAGERGRGAARSEPVASPPAKASR